MPLKAKKYLYDAQCNLLIHGYADIDDRLVWNIVETKLPTLKHEVSNLLQGE
ncbi:HepT-like ribonuclease domain-containing protein [Microbulbifer rhizosphaerae]|uniref:Uncharacterized protein with HEPN domain n=1 Tax=Microbulbifer rhizosphaerae TaxID=1562603 RepID=A0A7W4WEL0_9GAMM|nr:uncharacterized protein with HEPN domain [Microbulbifer rhizosphaerae]